MTASDIINAADLTDHAERLILADYLAECDRDAEVALLRNEDVDVILIDGVIRRTANALTWLMEHEFVVIRYVTIDGGTDVAWIPEETELPFDLADITGHIENDGSFESHGAIDALDWNSNAIWSVYLRVDESAWHARYNALIVDEDE